MNKERRNIINRSDRWSYLWLAIGTLLGFFWVIPLTTWLSSVFLLRFVRTQKVWRGILLVWLASITTLSIVMPSMMPLPLPAYLVTMAISTLMVGALPYLADRLLAHRLKGFAATLVFPLAMTAMDFISVTTSPMGGIGAQAYAQHGNLAFLQLLSVVADSYGRTLAAVDHFTASERVTAAQVPADGGVFTIYPIIRDLFGWLAVAGLAPVAVWAVIQGRIARRTESSQLEGQALA